MCCISSFYYIWDDDGVPKGDIRFYLALFGQALTGIANPFLIGIPTKVRNNIIRNVSYMYNSEYFPKIFV